ncbi:transcriptional regulator [Alkalicella caledoniensis]|uniref:protein acetyllysine N-acetyltransferase n=1 Tax=Alkalicella caledoniensis TaxID=2731377 RepID=A0A7G9WBJ2_ALKCA|nr:Sir2 family NAD-dependent protein deacetylase [Alkalicella caledoniensis]QNO16054.1 transcriptional regulator [Alkalicella caledoniensis]
MFKIATITGAGISKASGVPTFEERGDLRDKLSREFFESSPREFYDILLTMEAKIKLAKPNDAHLALAEFEVPIVTMNIDGLHHRAGSSNVVEIHGNLESVYCHSCNLDFDLNIIKENINCPECRRTLEPNVVLYGDMLPKFHEALETIGYTERLLVVGTSFYTSTVCELVDWAKFSNIPVDIINDNSETKVREYLKKYM